MFEHVTTQGLTAAAALAAAFLGPIATIIVGLRQVRGNVLSVHRQAWINALREDVVELMEKRIEFSQLIHPHPDGTNIICSDQQKANEIIERIRYLGYRIELRLRPNDEQHDRLIALLAKAPAPPLNPQLNAEIKEATRAILSQEWKLAAKAK
jgi:predicted RNase H-like nuclease (RuvC/YqgF family)